MESHCFFWRGSVSGIREHSLHLHCCLPSDIWVWLGFRSLARASYDWLLAVGVWNCSNDHEEKGVDPEDIARMQGLNNLARFSDSMIP